MRAIAIDIRESVFENTTEAILYVIKDTEGVDDTFVFSIPAYTFSLSVKSEKELDEFMKYDIFRNIERREKLIAVMKNAMSEFE